MAHDSEATNVIVISINIPDRFIDDMEDNSTIDSIAYQAALNIVSQLEEQGFMQKPDDPDYNEDDSGCTVEYLDVNGEYDRPGQ